MIEERRVFTYQEQHSERLDKFLVRRLPGYSRSQLQKLIKEGLVIVDGEPAHKFGQSLEGRSVVEVLIPAPRPSGITPEAIPLDVVFENEDLLVVNKPAGMVVHPGAGHLDGTLVHAALAHAPEMAGVGGELRPGVVHRLDKNTSGLILLAKNDAAQRSLQEQFRARKVEKVYIALVDGRPPTPSGRVETSIGRDTGQRKRMAVVASHKGREAISEYRTLESLPEHTLMEVYPHTGRTHQVRIHMKFLGCPITGDTVYGRSKPSLPVNRHFLHASRLTFRLPGESTPSTFIAPLPEDLEKVLGELRKNRRLQ